MSVGNGEQVGVGGWIFTYNTANVFFIYQSFCENIPTLTNHCISLLSWLTLKGIRQG